MGWVSSTAILWLVDFTPHKSLRRHWCPGLPGNCRQRQGLELGGGCRVLGGLGASGPGQTSHPLRGPGGWHSSVQRLSAFRALTMSFRIQTGLSGNTGKSLTAGGMNHREKLMPGKFPRCARKSSLRLDKPVRELALLESPGSFRAQAHFGFPTEKQQHLSFSIPGCSVPSALTFPWQRLFL